MKFIFALLLTVAMSILYSEDLIAQTMRSYTIVEANETIKIDGELNELAWQKAAIADSFTQTVPSPDKPSLYKSEIKMLYTKTSIIVGATLYQPRHTQLKQMTARDELSRVNADVFSIFLDTYNDRQNAFVFRVSSAGVLQDERNSNSEEGGDVSWDAVWNAKVTSEHDKWIVEVEIPYSAIRFSKLEEQVWGLNFGRSVRKFNESSYWNPINVQQQGFLNQSGRMLGLHRVKPPIRLFLFPYLTLGVVHNPDANYNTTQQSGGLDVKYGINESFTLDATLIPNFSQVVSDNLIRNLSPFEQQLNENRPFFTEGVELFNKAGLFYTRRVGSRPTKYYDIESTYGDTQQYDIKKNPNVTTLMSALKLSGRNKHNVGIGIFNAVGAPMYASVEDKIENKKLKIESEPLSNYNVIVIDKPLKGQSFINFTNTNVWKGGTYQDANVASLRWTQFDKNERHSFSVAGNASFKNDSSYTIGTYLFTQWQKTQGRFRYIVNNQMYSPDYDQTHLGIQFEFNTLKQQVQFSYFENKPKIKFLQSYRISTQHNFDENIKPFVFKRYNFNVNYFWLFKNFWDVTYEFESQPITPVDFYQLRKFNKRMQTNPYFWNGLGGSSDSRKKLFWAYYGGYGFSTIKKSNYAYVEQSIRYLLKSKLELSIKGTFTRDNSNIGYSYYEVSINEPIVARRNVREYEGIFSIKYNLNPNVNFTARFRHYNSFISNVSLHTVDEEGNWRKNPYITTWNPSSLDENFNLQNIDVFFNWMYKPGSRIVLSYKRWLQNAYVLNARTENRYFNNVYEVIKTNQPYEVTLRVIYFFDYSKFKK